MVKFLKSQIGIQFYKFIIVGIVSTIINYGVFYFFIEVLLINYLISSSLGFMSGVLVGYSINRNWTFESKAEKKSKEIIGYLSVYFFSLFLSLIVLKILVDLVKIDAKIANFFVLNLTTFVNFIGIKTRVFK